MPFSRRRFMQSSIALSVSTLSACATRLKVAQQYDAIISRDMHGIDNVPRFATVQAALDAAPTSGDNPYRVFIGKGRWYEKLAIAKPNIHLIGEDRTQSILAFDAYAGQAAPDGQPWGTSRTASLTVRAPDFAASNLTIENSFDYLDYFQKAKTEPTGSNRAQAVALMIDERADRVHLQRVNLVGYQDTLFVNSGRSLFTDCSVSGTVDFIFGAGRAVFDRCEIISRYRPNIARVGVIAAPSTLRDKEYGFIFTRCRLTKENQVPPNSVALGRAWRPTTTFADGRYGNPQAVGMAAYIECWMDDHIAVEGWDSMEYGARDGSRVQLQPKDARFYEYASRGPGAHVNTQRRLLLKQEASRYDIDQVLGDWRPMSSS